MKNYVIVILIVSTVLILTGIACAVLSSAKKKKGAASRTIGLKQQARKSENVNAGDEKKMAGATRAAWAIARQDEAELKACGLPLGRDIARMEEEAAKARGAYYLLRDARQIYLGDAGIRSAFDSVLEVAEYLPEGLRRLSGDGKTLPLHSMVWNTCVSNLKRQQNKLLALVIRPLETRDDPAAEVRAILREGQGVTERLAKAIDEYQKRLHTAEETRRQYAEWEDGEATKRVKAFCEAYGKLLDGPSCASLAAFSYRAGDCAIDNDGENVTLPNTVADYRKKVVAFADEIRIFKEKWNDL